VLVRIRAEKQKGIDDTTSSRQSWPSHQHANHGTHRSPLEKRSLGYVKVENVTDKGGKEHKSHELIAHAQELCDWVCSVWKERGRSGSAFQIVCIHSQLPFPATNKVVDHIPQP
jgi:hypothetical protein